MQEVEEGKSYLVRARDNYQNYDFENRLCVRIHSALRFYSAGGRGAVPKKAAGLVSPPSSSPMPPPMGAVGVASTTAPHVRKPAPPPSKEFVVYKETQL